MLLFNDAHLGYNNPMNQMGPILSHNNTPAINPYFH